MRKQEECFKLLTLRSGRGQPDIYDDITSFPVKGAYIFGVILYTLCIFAINARKNAEKSAFLESRSVANILKRVSIGVILTLSLLEITWMLIYSQNAWVYCLKNLFHPSTFNLQRSFMFFIIWKSFCTFFKTN